MNRSGNPGSLLVVVAPSGAGKTSLVRALLQREPQVQLSISFTTRAARPGEVHGVDYVFTDRPDFERRRAADEFLEWAEVHGNLYATSRPWIDEQTRHGRDILLEIDWQGALQIRQRFPESIGIFIAPPSIDELRRRLRERGQDSSAVIERRIAAAQSELAQAHQFEYVIINQEFAVALDQLCGIVQSSRLRFPKQLARYPELFQSLGLIPQGPTSD